MGWGGRGWATCNMGKAAYEEWCSHVGFLTVLRGSVWKALTLFFTGFLMRLLTLLRGFVWKRSHLILDGTFDLAEGVCMKEILPDHWQDVWPSWEGLYGRDLTLPLDGTFDLAERVCMEEISPDPWWDVWPCWEGLYGRDLTWSLMGLLTLLKGSVCKRSYLILDGTFDLAERVCMERVLPDLWWDFWLYWEGLYGYRFSAFFPLD